MIIFTGIIIALIFYSPFIFIAYKYGLPPNAIPLFIAIIALYTQIFLPKILMMIIKKIDSRPINDEELKVFEEHLEKLKSKQKNNDSDI